MKGTLYGVGIGPGDPELLTLKALRLIQENTVIAVPGKEVENSVAYQIVKGAYPQLDEKTLVGVEMPMTKDSKKLEEHHEKAADLIESYLRRGESVVFLTLGDPTVYATYLYVHKKIRDRGYETEFISGIPSFCAAAARLQMGLVETTQELHVIPATYQEKNLEELLKLSGTKVLMKNGKRLEEVREAVMQSGQKAVMIENCGMPEEKVYLSAEEMPKEAGYYTVVIVKETE